MILKIPTAKWPPFWLCFNVLTHWGRVTYICVSKLAIILDNLLAPGRRRAIIWSNAGILDIRNKLQWNLNRNSYIFIHENAFENVVCKMAAIYLGFNVLIWSTKSQNTMRYNQVHNTCIRIFCTPMELVLNYWDFLRCFFEGLIFSRRSPMFRSWNKQDVSATFVLTFGAGTWEVGKVFTTSTLLKIPRTCMAIDLWIADSYR